MGITANPESDMRLKLSEMRAGMTEVAMPHVATAFRATAIQTINDEWIAQGMTVLDGLLGDPHIHTQPSKEDLARLREQLRRGELRPPAEPDVAVCARDLAYVVVGWFIDTVDVELDGSREVKLTHDLVPLSNPRSVEKLMRSLKSFPEAVRAASTNIRAGFAVRLFEGHTAVGLPLRIQLRPARGGGYIATRAA